MKNNNSLLLLAGWAISLLSFVSCEEDVSKIGDSLISSDMTITVDSVEYNLFGKSVPTPSGDTRGLYTLLGSIDVPEYGRLNCSFVTRFMPSETLQVPDTIGPENVDSVKMVLTVPRKYVVGDSAAVQQIQVYSLTKQLPDDITASFNPEGYYSQYSLLGTKNFNLTGISVNDTTFRKDSVVNLNVKLPVELGRDAFKAYKDNPEIFIWPSELAKKWPGVLVQPSFGQGCVEAVSATKIYAYFPQTEIQSVKDENGEPGIAYVSKPDSVCLFSTAPEVLSNVNMTFVPSPSLEAMVNNGRAVITTPVGYAAQITFPAKDILKDYWESKFDIGVINNLHFTIPANPVPNNYGIGIPPALLMVKTSEVESFFAEGKVPDNINSFYSNYSSATKSYTFNSMRQYIVGLKDKGEEFVTDEDVSFTLIPVSVTSESYTNSSTGETELLITSALPYIVTPTMVELATDRATVVFTFTSQIIN